MYVFNFNILKGTVWLMLFMHTAFAAEMQLVWQGMDGDNKSASLNITGDAKQIMLAGEWEDYQLIVHQCEVLKAYCKGEAKLGDNQANITIGLSPFYFQLSDPDVEFKWKNDVFRGMLHVAAGIDQNTKSIISAGINQYIEQAWSLTGEIKVEGSLEDGLKINTQELAFSMGEDTAFDGVNSQFNLYFAPKSIQLKGEMTSGEFLWGDVYIPSIVSPIGIEYQQTAVPDKQTVQKLKIQDADRSTAVEIKKSGKQSNIQLTMDLKTAAPRYMLDTAETLGKKLEQLEGQLELDVSLDQQGVNQAHLIAKQVNLETESELELSNLNVDFSWPQDAQHSYLSWDSLSSYGIKLGEGRMALDVNEGEVHSIHPVVYSLWGGILKVEQFSWLPGMGFEAGVSLKEIDMVQMSKDLEWPELSGRLNGIVPALRYDDGDLFTEGSLEFNVFDGQIRLSNLSGERLSGVAPVLSADMVFENLDLDQLTNTMETGHITGKLNGQLNDFRLVNGDIVQFDAKMSTKGSKKRRISARALNSFSEVGGGPSGMLSNGFLSMFKEFSYDEINFTCKLQNEYCHMGGVKAPKGGFYLVKGAGLPRVDVVAYATEVNWPNLIKQFKSIAEGKTEVELKPN
ncbi:MAG: hypothetical protein ACWA5R_14995 [bacterium]